MTELLIVAAIAITGPIIGSLIGVLKKPSESFMYNMLSFAAGVMLAVSFVQLIPQSIKFSSVLVAALGIAFGTVLMYLVDKLIPHIHPSLCSQEQDRSIEKTATFLIIGLFIHNIPEGLAIASGFASSFSASIALAFAITIQKIPEGICTSAPFYYLNRKRLKSFLISAAGVFPLVFGLVLGYFAYQFIPKEAVGFIIAATAGLMIYVSSDELIPSSCQRTTNHQTIFSFMLGVLLVIFIA